MIKSIATFALAIHSELQIWTAISNLDYKFNLLALLFSIDVINPNRLRGMLGSTCTEPEFKEPFKAGITWERGDIE